MHTELGLSSWIVFIEHSCPQELSLLIMLWKWVVLLRVGIGSKYTIEQKMMIHWRYPKNSREKHSWNLQGLNFGILFIFHSIKSKRENKTSKLFNLLGSSGFKDVINRCHGLGLGQMIDKWQLLSINPSPFLRERILWIGKLKQL